MESLLDQALAVDGAARTAFLDDACGGDGALRAQVEALIEALEAAEEDGFLERAPTLVAEQQAAFSAMLTRPEPDLAEGTLAGGYRVIRPLGRGGMGVVYLAEDTALGRAVALKVVKRGMDTDEIVRRFGYEQRILARLEHPHIARLYGAGVLEDGRPYFAMEYVEGERLDAYCDARRLGVRERLVLFRDVCAAARFAHRNLVVHRDLKPSNVLVTNEGTVKLLDFGIAKLLADDPALGTVMPTQTGAHRMTPAYAAPEQVVGSPPTTATDVYALGVMLYELLTGRRPYQLAGSLADIQRIVSHDVPQRPSTAAVRAASVVHAEETTPQALSARRGVPPRLLRRQLTGDLDAIVLQALKKEPERRYASAGELHDDLERYLRGRPVVAQDDNVRYRLVKFVHRHRAGVAAAAVALLALLAGFIVAAWQANEARQAALRAEQQAARAGEMLNVMVGIFETVDPNTAQGRAILPEDLLQAGMQRIEALEGQPLDQAALMDVMGRVAFNLGFLQRADSLQRLAYTIRRLHLGELHPDVASSLYEFARARQYQRYFEEAVLLYRRALRTQRDLLGERHPGVIKYLNGLAFALYTAGTDTHGDESKQLFREAIEIGRHHLPVDDPEVVESRNGLALVLHALGERDEAEALYRQVLTMRRKSLGANHPSLADVIYSLARLLHERGARQEAETLYGEALSIYREALGESHFKVASTLYHLAQTLEGQGAVADAETAYREAAVLFRETRPPGDAWPAKPLLRLGAMLVRQGQPAQATPLLQEALDVVRQAHRPAQADVVAIQCWLGRSLADVDQYAAAKPLLVEGIRGALSRSDDLNPPCFGAEALVALIAGREGIAEAKRVEVMLHEDAAADE